MAQRVIDEWSKPELEYVEPGQVSRSFGYEIYAYTPSAETFEWLEKSLACVPEVDGEVAAERIEYPDAPVATEAIKRVAKDLGAAMVGVTRVDPYYVYKGMNVPHQYAVLMAAPMEYDEIKHGATGRHDGEVLKTYAIIGRIAVELGKYIRARGYPARAQTFRFEQINLLAHASAAGLGELGKHGSLINRELGCSFRLAAVTTDLPLVEDAPRDWGVDDFCTSCNMCVKFCPGDAISDDKQDVRGINKWVIDTEACAPYWGSHRACGICLQVCPLNASAFDGRYKRSFVEMIKGIDREHWREELREGLQKPWQYVERPKDHSPGWRNKVRGKGNTAVLLQGILKEGLPDEIYRIRAAMGISPKE